MALSYGATFISTSAIIGFGGAAAVYGMGVIWLTFMNIFVGIFLAFVFFGRRTRKMGHNLDAHTFPELLAKRYDSRFLQLGGGILIFVAMPLYAGSVIIGGVQFVSQTLKINYEVALLFFVAVVALYVVMGGLKGVMYADAFQGSLMFLGMLFLLVFTLLVAACFDNSSRRRRRRSRTTPADSPVHDGKKRSRAEPCGTHRRRVYRGHDRCGLHRRRPVQCILHANGREDRPYRRKQENR